MFVRERKCVSTLSKVPTLPNIKTCVLILKYIYHDIIYLKGFNYNKFNKNLKFIKIN